MEFAAFHLVALSGELVQSKTLSWIVEQQMNGGALDK